MVPAPHVSFCRSSTCRTKCCNRNCLQCMQCPSSILWSVFLLDVPLASLYECPWTSWTTYTLSPTLPLASQSPIHAPFLRHPNLPHLHCPLILHYYFPQHFDSASNIQGTWLASSLFEASLFLTAFSCILPCAYLPSLSSWAPLSRVEVRGLAPLQARP